MRGCRFLEDQDVPLVQVGGGKSNPYGFDGYFLGPICGEVLKELLGFRFAKLCVRAFTPDEVVSIDHGAIVLEISNESSQVRIGAQFGASYEDGSPIRKRFDVVAWRLKPDDWRSAGIWLCNWEEAWALACVVGKHLEVSELKIHYGTDGLGETM